MTSIAIRESRNDFDGAAVAVRRAEQPSLQAWAEEMTAAAQIARGIAGTPFVPATLRVMDRGVIDLQATTATVAAALLTGKEVGLEPMAALRSINVINGTPALNALSARALALARGHEVWVVESTKTRCIYQGRRFGSDRVQESTWTTDRAKDLGLLAKPNWRQQPIAMLIARATSEIVRLVAPEVLLGLGYTVEELQDQAATELAESTTEPAPTSTPPRRTAQRARRPNAAAVSPPVPSSPLPAVDDTGDTAALASDEQAGESAIAESETIPVGPEHAGALDQPAPPPHEPEPGDESPPDMVTPEQLKAIHAGFNGLGHRNRDERMAIIRKIIGREVESTSDLYRMEASTLIDEIALRRTRLAQADEDAKLQAAYEADMAAQEAAGQPATTEDEPPL